MNAFVFQCKRNSNVYFHIKDNVSYWVEAAIRIREKY